MAKLTNSSVTSYALSARKDFTVQHVKSHYSRPVKYSNLEPAFYSLKLKASKPGIFTYSHFIMFNKFINKFKFLKRNTYLKIRPYLNATKKPAEVRMGKGKGKFEQKIAVLSPGSEILEIRILKPETVSVEGWGNTKKALTKDVLPALKKLSRKLPSKALVTLNDL